MSKYGIVISLKNKGIRPFVTQGTISSSNSAHRQFACALNPFGINLKPVRNLYLVFQLIAVMNKTHPHDKDFSILITVHKNDIDELGHVNNVVYVRWVQEAAAAHWDSLTTQEIKQKYVWVVLRHEIDYLSGAFEGDTLTATTWVDESSGARSERIVQFTHSKTGKLLAKAKTVWCLLDGITMKPKRVDDMIVGLLNG